jgi:uncharacterized protein YjbI with pentapeptide repeats
MANQEHLAVLKQGVDVWNNWWRDNPSIIEPDFSVASLFKAALIGADLRQAILIRTDLERTKLTHCRPAEMK